MLALLRSPRLRLGRGLRLVLVGLCLLLAAGSALSERGATLPPAHSRDVVVAARALPAGQVVRPADVRVAPWPRALVPPGAPTRPAQVVGRRLSGPVAAREPLTRTRLLSRDVTSGLPLGTVAVPVTLADPHLGDFVHAGDHVDLVTTGDTTRPLASDVLVVALLPVRDDALGGGAGTELVVATDRTTAARIVRTSGTQQVAAVGLPASSP